MWTFHFTKCERFILHFVKFGGVSASARSVNLPPPACARGQIRVGFIPPFFCFWNF